MPFIPSSRSVGRARAFRPGSTRTFSATANLGSCAWRAVALVSLGVSVAAVIVAGCDRRDAVDPTMEHGAQVFRAALASDPETFDPAVMSGSIEGRVAYQLFEGLVAPAADGRGVKPAVAARWERSADQRQIHFYLRPDARWSNGDPVTSHDFIYAWKRILCRDVAADYVAFVEELEGGREFAEACRSGDRDGPWSGAVAPTEHELIVRAEKPTPWLLELLGFYTFFPVHRDTIEAHGQSEAFREEHLVGNGPWSIGHYALQDELVLERNDFYHGSDRVFFDRIRFSIIEDRRTAYHAFRAGRLDWVSNLPNEVLPFAAGSEEYRSGPLLGVYFFRFNVRRPPFDDPAVRRAFSRAIHREELTRCTLHGVFPATGFVPPMPGYLERSPLSFEPDRARALLESSGVDAAHVQPSFLYNSDENHRLIAESVQATWRRELGVEVGLRNTEWRVYLAALDRGDYDLARSGWIGDYTDPTTFLEMWTTGHPNNDTGWGNARYDALLAEASTTSDAGRRMQRLRQAEEILLDEAPVAPVFFYGQHHMVAADIEGWVLNPRDIHLVRRFRRAPTRTEAP